MAYAPGISNSSAALFILCTIDSFLTEIRYHINHEDLLSVSPSLNSLSNISQESSVTSMLDLLFELSDGARVFMSSDHGNKKVYII